jgi:hypothetical protein
MNLTRLYVGDDYLLTCGKHLFVYIEYRGDEFNKVICER